MVLTSQQVRCICTGKYLYVRYTANTTYSAVGNVLGLCVQEDLQHWRTKIATNNREWEVGVQVTPWVIQQAPCIASKSCMPCKVKEIHSYVLSLVQNACNPHPWC